MNPYFGVQIRAHVKQLPKIKGLLENLAFQGFVLFLYYDVF